MDDPNDDPGSNLPDEIKEALKNLVLGLDKEILPYREYEVREAKRNELLFRGKQYMWWDAILGDFNYLGYDTKFDDNIDFDITAYNKPVNIFKAFCQSLAGVLTTGLPTNKYAPQDSSNPEDLSTAETYTRAAERIQKENDVRNLLTRAIRIKWSQHFVASYTYPHFDGDKYGTVDTPITGIEKIQQTISSCPLCYGEISSEEVKLSKESSSTELREESELNETDPLDRFIQDHPEVLDQFQQGVNPGMMNDPNVQQDPSQTQDPNQVQDPSLLAPENQIAPPDPSMRICPSCGNNVEPNVDTNTFDQPYDKGTEKRSKCKQIIEIYGTLNVKIPSFVTRQADLPYVILETDHYWSQIAAQYPNAKIRPTADIAKYDRWARNFDRDSETTPTKVTLRRIWLRPYMFYEIQDEDLRSQLETLFPKGAMLTFVDEQFVEAFAENIDDSWTFAIDAFSDTIKTDPVGNDLVPLQEMTNDVFNLMVQVFEHSIPERFADPEYFNFEAYGQHPSAPGLTFPMRKPPGGYQDAIFESKPASLPDEVQILLDKLDSFSQFVTGIVPSIFGKQQGQTFGEGEANKQNALQRLLCLYHTIRSWWRATITKATKSYLENLLEDESYSKKFGFGYINVWIKGEASKGKIGEVDPEDSEDYPVSWNSQRAAIMELLANNNPIINEFMTDPSNIDNIAKSIGLSSIKIPKSDQRDKQLFEIAQIVNGQAVDIEPGLDDDDIHAQICKVILNSYEGRMAKLDHPEIYQAIVAHMTAHNNAIQQGQDQQQKTSENEALATEFRALLDKAGRSMVKDQMTVDFAEPTRQQQQAFDASHPSPFTDPNKQSQDITQAVTDSSVAKEQKKAAKAGG